VILSLFVQRTRSAASAPFRENDLAFINEIIVARPGAVIAMSYGNPHLIRKIGNVPAFLVGYGERGWYGNQAAHFDSFIKVLRGELEARGKAANRCERRVSPGKGNGLLAFKSR
jgi:hypothetical protein